MTIFWLYIGVIFLFHLSELLWNKWAHKTVTFRNLLISRPYLLAHLMCLAEFGIESYFFGAWKSSWHITTWIGLTGTILGQGLRLFAQIHARQSFTHEIRTRPSTEHHLVTDGPYAWVRHPGYLGWWVWAISTQLLLSNPVSTIVIAIWGWIFLHHRIQTEEKYLCHFFGHSFDRYRKETMSGLPFIA